MLISIFTNYKLFVETIVLLQISKVMFGISACRMTTFIDVARWLALPIRNSPNSHCTQFELQIMYLSVCPIMIPILFSRNGQTPDASTPLQSQIVGTIFMHNHHTLCKLLAINFGLRQILFDALFAVFRQVVLV
jgi:hypothetical protein